MVEQGLLDPSHLEDVQLPEDHVDYGAVIQFKEQMLQHAWQRMTEKDFPDLCSELESFQQAQEYWLEDYALFMAIKQSQKGSGWQDWPDPLRQRAPSALEQAKQDLADSINQQKFFQFLFFRQWAAIKAYAKEQQIRLIGDIPIFVSSDSADVWANHELFLLDKDHRPTVVAGVPPDYFCETGQLWGNPHYDWDAHREQKYAWWLARIRATLQQVDWIRLDHFCGFESAWHVPAGDETAIDGEYKPGPGSDFFASLRDQLGGLPFIAEDLGTVTPEVEALRDEFDLPGMRVLHFAFGDDAKNPFLPHSYVHNTVAYTGTHDNNTSHGWYEEIDDEQRDFFRRYAARDGQDVAWSLMRLAWSSVADVSIAPLQDVLRLGAEARMNMPGRPDRNWSFRFTREMLEEDALVQLAELTALYARSREE